MKKLTYKITTIFFILFCQLSLAGTTVDYQEILNKNFSGFVILSPSVMVLRLDEVEDPEA